MLVFALSQNSTAIQRQQTKFFNETSELLQSIGSSEKEFPCPNATAIQPCICTVDSSSRLNLDCSRVWDDDELNAVFLNHFPVLDFYSFEISVNPNVTQLQANCFGNVSFEMIMLSNTAINLISPYALTPSQSTLNYVHINYGFLTESTFPFDELDKYTNLDVLIVDLQQLTWVPPLSSNTLTILELYGNALTSIAPGNYA